MLRGSIGVLDNDDVYTDCDDVYKGVNDVLVHNISTDEKNGGDGLTGGADVFRREDISKVQCVVYLVSDY